MTDHSIGPQSGHQALLDELALLRQELAHLLTGEHERLEIVKPNLVAQYQQKIGAWELRRLQAEVAALRTKRRLELAQAAVNRGQAPDWTEIDGMLDLELLRWRRLVEEAAARLSAAEQRLSHLLAPGEDRELKKLYHALVKALHPDVHPRLTDRARRLWHRVQEAYQRQDLAELRALLVLAEEGGPVAITPEGIEALRRDCQALQKQIAEMERRLDEMERQPPFTFRAQLADDSWVARRRAELDAEIAQWETRLAALEHALAALKKLTDHGTISGQN